MMGIFIKASFKLKPMPRTKSEEKMVLISVHIPKQMLEELDELVRSGSFPSRSEAIRVAIRDLLIRERARGVEQGGGVLMSGR
jgi:metal-responsive CopG/Arc/MetJ family transcriptional regulator